MQSRALSPTTFLNLRGSIKTRQLTSDAEWDKQIIRHIHKKCIEEGPQILSKPLISSLRAGGGMSLHGETMPVKEDA